MSPRIRGKASVRRLIEERDRLLAEIAALQNQVTGLERAISLLDHEAPRDGETGGKAPQVKSLILSLLKEVGTTGLVLETAMDMAQRRGQKLNRGTVASTLSRLKREGAILHDGQRYRLPEFSRPSLVSNGGTNIASTSHVSAKGS
jgi:hypothetical protein